METQEKQNSNEQSESVPYIVHEGILARFERVNRRLWKALILLIILLVGSNVAWLIYESQFVEQVTVTQDVDTKESPAYVNGTGRMTVDGKSTPSNNKKTSS